VSNSMKLFKLLFVGALVTACGTSRVYHNSINSYEQDVTPVKNIFLIIQDAGAGKAYKKFEAYLQKELSRLGVDIHFFYNTPKDSLAENKIRDSAAKYRFDFIIKEMQGPVSDNSTTVIVGGRSNVYDGAGITGPVTFGQPTTGMYFMGYRKKEKYSLVWKCTCESMRLKIFQKVPKVAGECLIKSLAEQKLIPSGENK
jgi:hypothetical protein